MVLEPWVLVAAGCTAVGGAALAARGVLRMLCHHQERRLARENRALEQWWSVLADVPASALDPFLRRILGRAMLRRLALVARLSSDHPYLHAQRDAINRFMAGTAADPFDSPRRDRPTRGSRARQLDALQALAGLVDESADARLLSRNEHSSAAGAIGRAVETLEFLETQHASVEPDALRRLTRALGQGGAPGFGPAQSSRLFPTQ